ncbi:hypothetical protein F5Y00DRAFT_34070 [Daldinia vernicosa]|uniref:uncharacterized protein n=1 Tax=Daldinia vernicosa TaxID=114800 RepID=UPI0020075EAD|nr:uncharacterized protein F5Y00DRAFT_34070 [Daldinia vernicosa]KAI0850610.1 hypothetical protein F5Y00DRAFT_34070 [Daldinia vernicosa]
MANPVVAPWELDPEGDVLLTLHNPNAPFAVWDEYWYRKQIFSFWGQLVTEPQKSEPAKATPQTQTEATSEKKQGLPIPDQPTSSKPKVQFLLSSKHLSLSSGYFKNLLRGPWKEATPTSPDGRLCVDAEDWDENSLLLLMRIIHGHNFKVPKSMTLEEIAKVAVLVDYYQCHEAVMVWSDVWIDKIPNPIPNPDENAFNRDTILWILVAQVFRKEQSFRNATLAAIQYCKGRFPTLGLPITAVADRIDKEREKLLGQVFTCVYDLLKRLRRQQVGCSFACSSMMLGALSIQLHQLGIFEPQLYPPYPRYCYVIAISIMLNIATPEWMVVPQLTYAPFTIQNHACTLWHFLSPMLINKAKGIELADIQGEGVKMV